MPILRGADEAFHEQPGQRTEDAAEFGRINTIPLGWRKCRLPFPRIGQCRNENGRLGTGEVRITPWGGVVGHALQRVAAVRPGGGDLLHGVAGQRRHVHRGGAFAGELGADDVREQLLAAVVVVRAVHQRQHIGGDAQGHGLAIHADVGPAVFGQAELQ